MFKKLSAIVLALCLGVFTAAGCGKSESGSTSETTSQTVTEPAKAVTNMPKPDMSKWEYNEDDDVYYQTGISYCETPADENYEKLAVFVPGAYMDASDNGDGTFTCSLNEGAEVNGYTASTAPIVMPIETPGYSAAFALTDYEVPMGNLKDYTSRGLVYIYPGCRGIDEGVPAGVTDLKAAVRYIRYSDDVIAGDAEKIFAFGMSGGGAQAAVLGASGDSSLYDPYLEAVGAVKGVSDSVFGSMDWCPITSLDTANAEYEWMMGCTRFDRSDEEQAVSDALAKAFAEYVNSAGFTDENGSTLTLTESEEGIYQAGSYYEYIKSVIERSLSNYLSDTDFSGENVNSVFKNAKDYVDDLNSDGEWVTYDDGTNTVKIRSIADFVKSFKVASNLVVAFDQPFGENPLFGFGDGKGTHFDKILADILTELNVEYASDYTDDLKKTDSFGNTVSQRVDIYSPLYYLMKSREGFGTSNVAKHWRIRSGIEQMNTSVTTEVNLSLALESNESVESVDFETVWGQDHTFAERTGDSTLNFIEWVNVCAK